MIDLPDWTGVIHEVYAGYDRYSDVVTVSETGWVLLGSIAGRAKVHKLSFLISTSDNVDNDEIGIDIDGVGVSSRKIGTLRKYGLFGDSDDIWKLLCYDTVNGFYAVVFAIPVYVATSLDMYYNAASITNDRTIEILSLHHNIL